MLIDTAIRAANPREKFYKLFDPLGLYLEVASTGSKLWRLKYRYDGRENRLAAHAERNQVRAAYNKAQRLPERRKMMQVWGIPSTGCAQA